MNRKVIGLAVIAICVLFSSCASKGPAEPEPRELESVVKTETLEHKGTALGITVLPIWVETYVSTGITGLEKLADYQEDYCFVGETTATNLNAGQAWVNGFNIPQDIARNVSSRVDALFTGAASGSPEGKYGTYFENVVKSAADTTYTGARKVNDWWVKIRTYDADVKKKYTDEYRVFVLYTIPKDILDRQVLNMLNKVENDTEGTEEQKTAFNLVKEIMANEGL